MGSWSWPSRSQPTARFVLSYFGLEHSDRICFSHHTTSHHTYFLEQMVFNGSSIGNKLIILLDGPITPSNVSSVPLPLPLPVVGRPTSAFASLLAMTSHSPSNAILGQVTVSITSALGTPVIRGISAYNCTVLPPPAVPCTFQVCLLVFCTLTWPPSQTDSMALALAMCAG